MHIGWGLCDSLGLVLLCGGRYGLGGGVLLFILGSSLGGVGPVGGLRGVWGAGWERLGTSYLLISLVLGPLNSLFFFPTRPRLADALRCRGY